MLQNIEANLLAVALLHAVTELAEDCGPIFMAAWRAMQDVDPHQAWEWWLELDPEPFEWVAGQIGESWSELGPDRYEWLAERWNEAHCDPFEYGLRARVAILLTARALWAREE